MSVMGQKQTWTAQTVMSAFTPKADTVGSPYRSGRSPHWVKVKNPKAPAVKREAEEDWRR
jgi:hypothetical protein